MKRKTIHWKWEDIEAQKAFSQWQGFPDYQETKAEIDKTFHQY